MKMLLFIWVSMLGLPVQSFAEASTSYDSFLIERVECAVSVRWEGDWLFDFGMLGKSKLILSPGSEIALLDAKQNGWSVRFSAFSPVQGGEYRSIELGSGLINMAKMIQGSGLLAKKEFLDEIGLDVKFSTTDLSAYEFSFSARTTAGSALMEMSEEESYLSCGVIKSEANFSDY